MGNKMIDVNEKYVFKVRECCLPLENCQFRCEDLTCALEEDCVVIKRLRSRTMETKQKEMCENCEIINADCEGCKAFNKNTKYDRYSCVNCKFLKKDEEYPNEEHYKCVKCGYWFDTLEQADNNDNHHCLLPNYEGEEELPMYFEEKEQNNGN